MYVYKLEIKFKSIRNCANIKSLKYKQHLQEMRLVKFFFNFSH